VPYIPDLAGLGPEKPVGYLWYGHSFPRGRVSPLLFERLVALVELPLMYACGYHECNVNSCGLRASVRSQPTFQYRGRVLGLGSSEIWVPGDKVVYQAPSLILHYIRHHKYQPPKCFCAAVLNCPKPDSAEYFAAIEQSDSNHFLIRHVKRFGRA
jgi:hypothetical protein